MPRRQPYFSPELFAFLRALARHNEREWFNANKRTYEEHVKAPLLHFIGDFGPHLAKVSKRFVADPRPVGGSMFRIYRDTRFAKDKRPYKTNAGAHFRHAAGKDAHAPGFYLHLAPGEAFAAAGLWRPEAKVAAEVRAAIADQPQAWKRAVHNARFRGQFRLGGESLKRPPRGFDPDHPLIEDLQRKDWIASVELSEKQVCAPDFIDRFAKLTKGLAPMMKFLTEAVGQRF